MIIASTLLLSTFLLSAPADQSAPPAETPASEADGGNGSESPPVQERWIKRHRPTALTFEIGVFGGVLVPPSNHELYVPSFGHQEFTAVAPDVGLRLGFYPLSFLGLEVEGAVMPTRTEDDSAATIFGFRGHALGQLPYRVLPAPCHTLRRRCYIGRSGASHPHPAPTPRPPRPRSLEVPVSHGLVHSRPHGVRRP